MKVNILNACRRNVRSAVAIAALLGLGGITAAAEQPFNPVGTTWDCLISGSGQQGIAFLTFTPKLDAYGNFTFTGYQLLVGKQSTGSSGGGGRNPGGDVGRSNTTDTNAPTGSGTNLFGFGSVDGSWRIDEKGRVIGYFLQLVNQQTTVTTNFEFITINYTTNAPPYTTNITIIQTNTLYLTNTTATTNGISFSAKGASGKRLNLVSSTPNGKVTYKGVPQDQKPIPAPIIGSWYGTKKENGQTIVEFFNLLPTAARSIYVTTNGNGPNLKLGGYSMVSVQKKMGFAFATFEGLGTNDVPIDANGAIMGGTLSATIGSVSYPAKGTKANTKGFESPMTSINFQAQRQQLQ